MLNLVNGRVFEHLLMSSLLYCLMAANRDYLFAFASILSCGINDDLEQTACLNFVLHLCLNSNKIQFLYK